MSVPANRDEKAAAIGTSGDRRTTGPPVVSSSDLLAGGRELVIRHGQEDYRLRLTSQNKLILTK